MYIYIRLFILITAISYGGGVNITLSGEGFDPESVKVSVCGEDCVVLSKTSTQVICDAPNVPGISLDLSHYHSFYK